MIDTLRTHYLPLISTLLHRHSEGRHITCPSAYTKWIIHCICVLKFRSYRYKNICLSNHLAITYQSFTPSKPQKEIIPWHPIPINVTCKGLSFLQRQHANYDLLLSSISFKYRTQKCYAIQLSQYAMYIAFSTFLTQNGRRTTKLCSSLYLFWISFTI